MDVGAIVFVGGIEPRPSESINLAASAIDGCDGGLDMVSRYATVSCAELSHRPVPCSPFRRSRWLWKVRSMSVSKTVRSWSGGLMAEFRVFRQFINVRSTRNKCGFILFGFDGVSDSATKRRWR